MLGEARRGEGSSLLADFNAYQRGDVEARGGSDRGEPAGAGRRASPTREAHPSATVPPHTRDAPRAPPLSAAGTGAAAAVLEMAGAAGGRRASLGGTGPAEGEPAPGAGAGGGLMGALGRARESVSAYAPPSRDQMAAFGVLLGAGGLFLAVAFFVCLPVVVLSPHKFALSFTVGCALVLAAFAALRGFRAQLSHMLSRDRLPLTAGYLAAMAGTVYAAVGRRSYLLTVAFCGLQCVGLLYYLASYFPGGAQGVHWVLGAGFKGVVGGARALLRGGRGPSLPR